MTLAHTVVYAHNDWWPLFPALWLGFWAFIVFVVIRRRRHCGPWNAHRTGEAVLAERFARGEIDEHEYSARLAVLRPNRKD